MTKSNLVSDGDAEVENGTIIVRIKLQGKIIDLGMPYEKVTGYLDEHQQTRIQEDGSLIVTYYPGNWGDHYQFVFQEKNNKKALTAIYASGGY